MRLKNLYMRKLEWITASGWVSEGFRLRIRVLSEDRGPSIEIGERLVCISGLKPSETTGLLAKAGPKTSLSGGIM